MAHLAIVVVVIFALSNFPSQAFETTEEYFELFKHQVVGASRIKSTSLEEAVAEEGLFYPQSSDFQDFEASGEGSGEVEVVITQNNASGLLSTSNDTNDDVTDDWVTQQPALDDSSHSEITHQATRTPAHTTVVTIATSDDEDLSSSGDSALEQENVVPQTTRDVSNQWPTSKSGDSSEEFEFHEGSGMTDVDQSQESTDNSNADKAGEKVWPDSEVKRSTPAQLSDTTTKQSDLANAIEGVEWDSSKSFSSVQVDGSADVFDVVLGESQLNDSTPIVASDVIGSFGANGSDSKPVLDPLREETLEENKAKLSQTGEVKSKTRPRNRIKTSELAGGVIGTVFGLVLISAVILVILKFRGSLFPGRSYSNPNTTETV